MNKWFDKYEDDRKIERELYPMNGQKQPVAGASKSPRLKALDETTLSKFSGTPRLVTYKIYVLTSDKLNAGTDANVYIHICGTQSNSG